MGVPTGQPRTQQPAQHKMSSNLSSSQETLETKNIETINGKVGEVNDKTIKSGDNTLHEIEDKENGEGAESNNAEVVSDDKDKADGVHGKAEADKVDEGDAKKSDGKAEADEAEADEGEADEGEAEEADGKNNKGDETEGGEAEDANNDKTDGGDAEEANNEGEEKKG